MTGAQLLLAVSAGMVAAANPCGFAMLPAYLSLLVADRDEVGRHAAGPARGVGPALLSGLAVTGGFVGVFGAFGLALAPVANWVQPPLPWLTVLLGAALAVVGARLAAGRRPPSPGRGGDQTPPTTGSPASMVLFGAAYAVASLSCTIAPFLAIVVAGRGLVDALLLLLAYAGGIGLVVGLTPLTVALVRTSLLRVLPRACAALSRAGGVLLVLAGGYVAYYAWYELRVQADPTAADRDLIVRAVTSLQQGLVALLERAGVGTLLGVFAGLLAAALLAALVAGRPVGTPRRRQGGGADIRVRTGSVPDVARVPAQ